MSSVANPDRPVTANSRANLPSNMDSRNASSNSQGQNTTGNAAHPPAAMKKGKGKKSADPVDTNKLVEQHLARLERDLAGDREQEAEIEREVKKANRDLSHEISGYDNPLARIEAVQTKYSKLYGEMKRLEREHTRAKKRADQLQKEKDTAKSELNKMTTIKEKLEKLSRETSNENRKLRADVQRYKDFEAKKRAELESRLEQMVIEVEDVMQSNESSGEQAEVFETDELFRQKFKSFVEQYELRELHFQSILRTKELEIQYQMARFEQQRKAQELESTKSNQLTRQVSTFSQTETELRSQLNIYVEKFKQVEDTLNNSNDLFLTFRKEMEEMSKKTKRLEKENLNLTRKHEATNQNILQMAQDRTKAAKEIEQLKKRNDQLEKLCRGMQAQGRGQINMPSEQDLDEEGTDSEYDEYDDLEDEGSVEAEYDDETEEEPMEPTRRPFGPVPPPPQSMANGNMNGQKNRQPVMGQVNGIKA